MRIDSEFFATKYLQIIDTLSHVRSDKLSKITTWITQGPNPSSVDYKNIPCLTGRNICDGRVTYENADYVSDHEYNNYKRFQIRPNDTLITLKGKGSIGKIGFVTSNKTAIFSRNIGVVRPIKDVIDPAYLNAYILSYYGHNMVLRGETGGTGQSTLTCSYIKSLNVPRFNIETEIGDIIRKSEKVLQDAKCKFLEAEHFLANILSVDTLCLHTDNTAVKLASQSFKLTDRLDAEYYQPKYEQIVQHIAKYPQGCDTIGNLFLIRDKNYIPVSDKTYQYIELSNIGSDGSITGHTEALGENLPSRARRIVHSGDIIVSSLEGSLQSCALISDEYNNAICSTGFYVLSPKSINTETALVLFKSQPIQSLMTQVCSGSIMAAMSTAEFTNIKLPKIDDQTQQQIKKIIQESIALEKESVRLLNLAKSAVEIAIEQGEDKALELLKSAIS